MPSGVPGMPSAVGAYKALKENGRTEIKLYSIDISNRDLQLMREPVAHGQ